MKIVVLKFGGTSVGSIERIKNVSKIIISYLKKRYKVIAVSSAMSGETNKLVELTKKISNNFISSEYDSILATGEQVACSLLAGRLNDQGYLSRSWLGWQIPIFTQGKHSYSRIFNIKRKNIINNKIITGISSTQNDAKVTLVGVKDKPGIAASIFRPLSRNSINVDMVVQNISANGKETDLTFTIKNEDLNKTKKIIKENKSIKFKDLIFDKDVSKVSIIGVGMVTTPGVTYRMFQALANKNINIQVISTSEIKISVLIDKKNLNKAVLALHNEFKLDK